MTIVVIVLTHELSCYSMRTFRIFFFVVCRLCVLGVECDKRKDLHYVLSALLEAWGVYLRLSH